ncbi:protein Niban 1-like [Brienomyrus brachyistius]|uniref:protein Niban 1-like n=1 Tax=Brienomyrus brachyistius TaxID=42636 RepID=UPI0020B40EB9|nr:protein Niban 1-like [Brienomyrus brachyistius]
MGSSSSSLLDESRSNYIRGQTEAKLKNFSPHYRRQYLVTFFSQVQDEVEQHKTGQPQLLKRREAPEESEVIYKETVLHFDDTRKWKERLVVVRADYSLECHDSHETFTKGAPPRYKLQPTGGTVLTSEEKYMAMVDKAFPDPNSTKEEPAAPLVAMPGPFPVYLQLPYSKHAYFCFDQEDRRVPFVSVLNDCIRHQNHDFLKKTTCEVQAFVRAVQLHRQEKGHYESWDMLTGSDVQVLANLVMEELVPTLQTEIVPRLKGKKMERKRVWFATVEAAYLLVQEQLSEGLASLKEECSSDAKKQEAQIRENMDQIVNSKNFLAGKLEATVSEAVRKFCAESVQPYLSSILEELMGPISLGFQEARLHCERAMDRLCQEVQEKGAPADLKGALDKLGREGLQDCHQHLDVLTVQLQELRNRFKFSNVARLVHCALIDIQQLMENAAYTFEILLSAALKGNPANPASDIEKVKHRVLKQYDYDSSTVRKRIFQEALVDVTLPAIQRNLAPTYKLELQKFDQYIFADCTNFIQVENVYEDILLQILEGEISKVVKEAAKMKKHNLFVDSTDHPFVSQGSLSDSRTPPTSSPASPAKTVTSQRPAPTSPLLGNGGPVSQQQEVTPITAKEADAETPGPAPDAEGSALDAEGPTLDAEGPAPDAEGSAPGSEVTAQAEHVVEHIAALSINCAGTDTDGMIEDRVMATAQQQVTDRAVYLRCPAEIKEGSIVGMDGPVGVEDGTVMAGHVKVKDNGSGVNDSLPGKDGTVFKSEVEIRESTEERSAEVKENGKKPQEGLEDNPSLESGTVHHVPCVEEDSGIVHNELCAETVCVTDLFTTPAAESNSEASSDPSKEVTGHLDSCITNTGDSGGTALVSQDADSTGSNGVSGTTDQALQAGEPAVTSHSEVEPAGGACDPSKANVSADDSSDPAEEKLPLDSIKGIRDLVVEIIEVEELVQRNPDNDQV